MKTFVPSLDEKEEMNGVNQPSYPKVGILEWFRKDDYTLVENTINDLKSLGIHELKTVISFQDYESEDGINWLDWLFSKISEDFKILPCLNFDLLYNEDHVMQSGSEYLFHDFLDKMLDRYGQNFDYIELDLDKKLYPAFTFGSGNLERLISQSIEKITQAGKKAVLGGLEPADLLWNEMMQRKELLLSVHAVGISAFPEEYKRNWKGWNIELDTVEKTLRDLGSGAEIWITETGYSTVCKDDQQQISKFIEVLKSPARRIYWRSLYDLSPYYASRNGFHQDERDYHFGLKKFNGMPKLLYRMLTLHPAHQLENESLLSRPGIRKSNRKGVLITVGAGFIGTNLAKRLLNEGKRVIIYDNLSRPGVENNLKWLLSSYPDLEIIIADVTDFYSLQKAVNEAEHVFHFAAQVAVTNSLEEPFHDFEVNAGGTVNVLEAIRQSRNKPSLLFTSTNKVYGNLSGLELKSDKKRYYPLNTEYYKNGINENYPLNFLSPYGNSKGCADQYVLDYARSFGLLNVVFRMSCIYGPHQFGTEDQGWIAHFLNQSIRNKTITIYGDGKQVRDVLFVDDLVEAFLLAMKNIRDMPGQAFNIGGGPANSISLLDLISYMHKLDHLKIKVIYDLWRTGDQKYYVTDTRKFREKTGWQPKISYQEGIANIFAWLYDYQHDQNQKIVLLK